MKIEFKDNRLKKFQEGGAMPADTAASAPAEPAPAPELAGGSPEEQLLMACQQALETLDCQLAMLVMLAILQMAGGGALEQAPAAPEGQEPVYRKGGRLVRYLKK